MTRIVLLGLLGLLAGCVDSRGVRCDPLTPGYPLCGI